MNLTARSSAAALLGLTIALGAPAAPAFAFHESPSDPGEACEQDVPSTTNPHCMIVNGSVVQRTTTTAGSGVQGAGLTPQRAHTGAGGSSSSGSEGVVLLVGSGLVLLAAVGVRRASRGGKA